MKKLLFLIMIIFNISLSQKDDNYIIIKFKNNSFQDIDKYNRNRIIDVKDENNIKNFLLSNDKDAIIARRDPSFDPKDTIYINEKGEKKKKRIY